MFGFGPEGVPSTRDQCPVHVIIKLLWQDLLTDNTFPANNSMQYARVLAYVSIVENDRFAYARTGAHNHIASYRHVRADLQCV